MNSTGIINIPRVERLSVERDQSDHFSNIIARRSLRCLQLIRPAP